MREDTKLAALRLAMQSDDWDQALRLAARFQRLGKHATSIRRAADSLINPNFYQQLGFDLETLKAEGVAALKERFSKSWEDVQKSEQ